MIRITRSMLNSKPDSTVSTFKKIYAQNREMHKFLLTLQSEIQKGAGPQQIAWLLEEKLRHFESFNIEWPAPQKPS